MPAEFPDGSPRWPHSHDGASAGVVWPAFLKIKLPLSLKEANLGLLTRQQGAKNVEIESAKPLEAEALEPHTVSQGES